MRLQKRRLNTHALREAIDTFEIIETYPDDKYPPSFLLPSMLSWRRTSKVIMCTCPIPNGGMRTGV